MNKPPLAELHLFTTVVAAGSFRAAADALEISPSAVSHRMRSLEARLGTRLLQRTTRSMSLTEAGQRLFDTLSPALRDITTALDDLDDHRARPRGVLRINAPRALARLQLLDVLARLHAAEPDVRVQLTTNNAFVDLAADGYDAGVRFRADVPADMIAHPLGPPPRFSVVATPAYLREHGTPGHPQDLRDHRCIGLTFGSGRRYAWEFECDGQQHTIRVHGDLDVDDTQLAYAAALDGWGLAYVYEADARAALEAGTLRAVLTDWCPDDDPAVLYYPSRRQLRPAMRCLVDQLLRDRRARERHP